MDWGTGIEVMVRWGGKADILTSCGQTLPIVAKERGVGDESNWERDFQLLKLSQKFK